MYKMSPNCEYGRRGLKPEAIVVHVSEGSFDGSYSWLVDPKSQVSYHFLFDTTGIGVMLVDPINTAWHAGAIKNSQWSLLKPDTNPNLYTIGIAFAGYAGTGPSRSQIVGMAKKISELAKIYNIPLDNSHIIPHNIIRSDKTCPGNLCDLNALIYLAGLPELE